MHGGSVLPLVDAVAQDAVFGDHFLDVEAVLVDVLDVVNMRHMGAGHGPSEGSIEAPLSVLAVGEMAENVITSPAS